MQTNQIVKDDELFERLRALRRKLAQEQGVPPFVVFSDETLREMSGKVPLTDEEPFVSQRSGRTKKSKIRSLYFYRSLQAYKTEKEA